MCLGIGSGEVTLSKLSIVRIVSGLRQVQRKDCKMSGPGFRPSQKPALWSQDFTFWSLFFGYGQHRQGAISNSSSDKLF